jgi:hypothetical protein
MAFSYMLSDEERTLGMVVLDSNGQPIDEPCSVAPSRSVANDPDVACVEGYCAVVWMEASEYSATDYITRIVQLPASPELHCP